MNPQEIIELLGCGINKKIQEQFLKELGMTDIKEFTNSSVPNGFKSYSSNSRDEKIYFEFMGKERYRLEYFKIRKENKTKKDELILFEVTFYLDNLNNNLPYDLRLNRNVGEIKSRLGTPYKSEIYDEEPKLIYLISDYKILLSFNPEHMLKWVRFWIIDMQTYNSIERRNNLDKISEKIQPDNITRIKEFSKIKPTKKWLEYNYERLEELEEENLTKEEKNRIIKQIKNFREFCEKADNLFDDFLNEVIKNTKKKNAYKIYETIEFTILELNKLNKKYNEIHTMEREDICEFVELITRETGFEIKEGDDITLEWREW